MKNLIMTSKYWLKTKFNKLLKEERGEVNVVAIVVLIGIAILLALIFKEQISNLLETLFRAISDNAEKAVTE